MEYTWKIEPWNNQICLSNNVTKMKENISSWIAYCNRAILKWYQEEFPLELKMGEFTPVDKNNEEIIDTIYQMYLILKDETKTKVHLLLPVVKYYFAVSVVEYYVLDCRCPLFNGVITKQMIEFSLNTGLSKYRKKMMGFNSQPYQMKSIKAPYKFNISTKEKKATKL